MEHSGHEYPDTKAWHLVGLGGHKETWYLQGGTSSSSYWRKESPNVILKSASNNQSEIQHQSTSVATCVHSC